MKMHCLKSGEGAMGLEGVVKERHMGALKKYGA